MKDATDAAKMQFHKFATLNGTWSITTFLDRKIIKTFCFAVNFFKMVLFNSVPAELVGVLLAIPQTVLIINV